MERIPEPELMDEGLAACRFDAVISNSLLHHLDDPAVLWETVSDRHVLIWGNV